MRFQQPFDVFVAVARQPDRDLVIAVDRELVTDECAAARAERKPVEMFLLRQIGPEPHSCAARRKARPSDGELANLLRCRHVAFEQRRGEIPYRDVVEPISGRVVRQQRRRVDFERQQVANGVAVFGPV